MLVKPLIAFGLLSTISACASKTDATVSSAQLSAFDSHAQAVSESLASHRVEGLISIPGPHTEVEHYLEARNVLDTVLSELEVNRSDDERTCAGSLYQEFLDETPCSYLVLFDALLRFQGVADSARRHRYVENNLRDIGFSPFESDECMNVNRASADRVEVRVDDAYRLAWVNYRCRQDKIFLRELGWVSAGAITYCGYYRNMWLSVPNRDVVENICSADPRQ